MTFKGLNQSTFNSEFTQIFDSLSPYLFYLDISGQNLGDDGISKLSDFIKFRGQPNDQLPNIFTFKATTIGHPFLTDFTIKADGSLQYIKYDEVGYNIKCLATILETIVSDDNQIKKAEWNQNEINKLIKKISSLART